MTARTAPNDLVACRRARTGWARTGVPDGAEAPGGGAGGKALGVGAGAAGGGAEAPGRGCEPSAEGVSRSLAPAVTARISSLHPDPALTPIRWQPAMFLNRGARAGVPICVKRSL